MKSCLGLGLENYGGLGLGLGLGLDNKVLFTSLPNTTVLSCILTRSRSLSVFDWWILSVELM